MFFVPVFWVRGGYGHDLLRSLMLQVRKQAQAQEPPPGASIVGRPVGPLCVSTKNYKQLLASNEGVEASKLSRIMPLEPERKEQASLFGSYVGFVWPSF